jgi:hypothetical protein
MIEPFREGAPTLAALRRELEACKADVRTTREQLRSARPWSWWRFGIGLALPLLLSACQNLVLPGFW